MGCVCVYVNTCECMYHDFSSSIIANYQDHLKKVTEQFPDDVEAWIELAGILEQNDITVSKHDYCQLHTNLDVLYLE